MVTKRTAAMITRQRQQVDYTLGLCYSCNGLNDIDAEGTRADLLKCFDCHRNVHASCLGLDKSSIDVVQSYDWECTDCKCCLVCQSNTDEDKIVFCDHCDRGYHTFCCDPQLKSIPKDNWYCSLCSSIPSPPSSPPKLLLDNTNNSSFYSLRRSPTHTAKFIEMTRQKEKPTISSAIISPTPLAAQKRKKNYNDETGTDSSGIKIHLKLKAETKKQKTANEAAEEEEFYKSFGNKLTKSQANLKRGTPSELDKSKFEKSMTTLLKKKVPHGSNELPKINQIVFNNYVIDTWYVAPYPEEYSSSSTLYICEFCMKYMRTQFVMERHQLKCTVEYPPGEEIYRDKNVSIFEVDGRKNKIYCQNLCLLAKMFLDHKTLYYDVEPFLFYIMTEVDEHGCHFVGYFSKEKRSAMNYNVSCILTMPIYQRKGYGQFLIDFSYLLSKRETKPGSPERPLSDLGLISYRSYWKNVLFRELKNQDGSVSIEELSNITSLTPDDIISTLQSNNMIQYDKLSSQYSIIVDMEKIVSHLEQLDAKNYIKVNPNKLNWVPFVLSKERIAILLGQSKLTIKNIDESSHVDII